MAKTIKFNLMLDGRPVRTIEELKENFNIDDILWAYQNQKTLERWLSVRGCVNELEKLKQLKSPDRYEICKELISIFEVEKDEEEIRQSLYHIEASDNKENRLNNINHKDIELNKIINKYHSDYKVLKNEMLNQCDDYSFLKVQVSRINSEFIELFKIDYWNYFTLFYEKAPLGILTVLGNKELRKYFIDDLNINKELQKLASPFNTQSYIKKSNSDEYKYLSKFIKRYEKKTQGVWENVEPRERNFMILNLGAGCVIRNADKSEEEIKTIDKINLFPVLNGIDYKSKKNDTESIALYYMEV